MLHGCSLAGVAVQLDPPPLAGHMSLSCAPANGSLTTRPGWQCPMTLLNGRQAHGGGDGLRAPAPLVSWCLCGPEAVHRNNAGPGWRLWVAALTPGVAQPGSQAALRQLLKHMAGG